MSEFIAPADFIAVMQESFDRGQDVTFTPSGNSMLPMLDGKKDQVTLSKKPESLKKYDIAFYIRRRTNQLVLHRMIGFSKSGEYIFCGDNQYDYEHGVGDDDILALMTAFTHNGKEVSVTDFSYRFYVRRMMLKKRIRRFASKIYHIAFK